MRLVRRARKITRSGTSRWCVPPSWPKFRPCAAAWSSSPGGTPFGRTFNARSTRCSKTPGHQNAYFPLFIPLSYLEKEAAHVEGFAKECAVVTHHRLEAGPDGGLVPTAPLEEPLVVRPTSETIIGAMYAKWVQSYRDLPILINQWANVVRWEMRTRLFLRTTEFLWQEGHTAHANKEEAVEETLRILDLYATFAQDYMAMPVIRGEKTAAERFPGAVDTYAIEAMMQDRKALQAGTSHFLGQNFSKAQEIKFLSSEGREEFCWTTSWGVSTRLVGGLVMTHGDDDGIIVPPRLAPSHVVILPIFRNDEEKSTVMDFCRRLEADLKSQLYDGRPVRVLIDARDLRGGDKVWQHIKRGVPIRLEIGPRDVAGDAVFMARRDKPGEKAGVPRGQFVSTIGQTLTEMQTEPVRAGPGLSHREHAQDRQRRRVQSLVHTQERRRAGNPRRLCAEPRQRRPRSRKNPRRFESHRPLPPTAGPTARLRPARQMHFHR